MTFSARNVREGVKDGRVSWRVPSFSPASTFINAKKKIIFYREMDYTLYISIVV